MTKVFTYEELEKMSIDEIMRLCEELGMTIRTLKTFTRSQMTSYVYGKQHYGI